MDAEREAVAGSGDVVEQRIEAVGTPAHDVKDRPEHLLPQIARTIQGNDGRRDVGAPRRQRLEPVPAKAHAAGAVMIGDPAVELLLCLDIDYRADRGPRLRPIA